MNNQRHFQRFQNGRPYKTLAQRRIEDNPYKIKYRKIVNVPMKNQKLYRRTQTSIQWQKSIVILFSLGKLIPGQGTI